ncbi:hypothetical protein KKG66_09400, partial [bacterium]|nr:hypothetical protein [bacterium]
IDRTEWIVQPENVIGNSHPVTLPEFYGTWSETPLIVYDEDHNPHPIPNPRDLVGYSQSNQLRYREDEMNMCTDHEWLIHIECDELPNCIEDSTEYNFYSGAGFPVSWRNFETIVDYYHPMVENLRASLDTISVFIDEGLSTAPTNFRVDRVIENRAYLLWNRGGDPYFESYRIYYDTASGISTQSPCITADELANLCWQLTDRAAILDLLYDQDYYFALSASDQFGHESDLTPVVMAHTENTPRLLTPVGGELWDYRIPNLVQWTGDGYEAGVWIDVNRDYPHGEWDVLAGGLADDGQEMVVVGDPLSEHCRIRVRTEDMQISAISPGDFSIISVLGYLQIKLVELPGDPIYFWNAGSLECPDNAELTIQLSNPGYAPIIVAAPALVFGDHFSLENECLTERILPPLTTDSCSLSVSFTETSYGIYRDTLQILTDAINAQNNLLSLPLVAERTITVPAPDIVLQPEGTAIRISWDPVTESIQGCPIAATYRVWYYHDEWANRYHLGDITDTTYVHEGILNLVSKLFYEVHIVSIE